MNALIKKHNFLLCWTLSVFCYFFSVSTLAAARVDPVQADVISENTSSANSPIFVFVDTKLDNYQALVKDIEDHKSNKNITIVYLDPERNGIQQMTDTLASQTGVAEIHLLTHGMAGSIQLGNAALSQNTMDLYTHQLAAWSKSLSGNADILIYGCDVTSTDAGLQLIKQIGDLTQAHIAASKNVTGAASFGADWNLESHYGKVQTNVIISAQTQQSWASVMGYTPTYIYIDGGAGSVDQPFRNTSNVGTKFTYDSPGGTYSVNRVAVQLRILAGADTSQNITLCLRATWNGADLACSSMPTTRLTTSFAWYAFNLSATTLNDNGVYYIQIYTLSTDLKTVANIWNTSKWGSSVELVVGVLPTDASKDLTFILTTGTNTTPTVSNAIPDQTGTPNVAFNYTVASNAFADADIGDYLTYTATLSNNAALPAWLSFNSSTRTFSGTPTTSTSISVKVTASDGTATISDTFDFVANTAPVVNSAIPDQAATEGVAFSFAFSGTAFTDADGDTLTYSATLSSGAALPAWLSFNAATRTFSGTPLTANVGTISVKVTASDGIATITDTFDIVVASSIHHYGIVPLTASGVTCAALQITITAYNSSGTPIAPANGTVITLSTSTGTGSWVGGNTATFDGVVTSKTKFLQHTTATSLNINVTDGSHSESASIDPTIVFDAATLSFYGSSGLGAMTNQVAGVVNSDPILKTTNCAAQAHATASQNVQFAYECRDPTTCVVGQTLSVNGNNIQSNANAAVISYSAAQTLAFDGSGIASIPIKYTDVGKVKIYASMVIAAEGNNPAITLTANSGDFIVKPYSLEASVIQTSGGVANPGGSSAAGAGNMFVSAGTAFTVKVVAKNGATPTSAITPNFGREATPENVKFVERELVYPTVLNGGILTPLTNPAAFTADPTPGTFINTTIAWNQVGSIKARPELADGNYLGAGDIDDDKKILSGTIGRFYPDHITLTSTTTNTCPAGSFTFMDQPTIGFNYTLEAKSATNVVLTNYDATYTTGTLSYVAENNDSGDGASYTLARIGLATPPPAWADGVVSVASSTTKFARQTSTAPDGPYASFRYGLKLTDNFDSRSIESADMNAATAGACSPCDAKTIGSALNVRYGRLRLDGNSGPESLSMPVNFVSEYWNGTNFLLNSNDSCTIVPLAAITYPSGTLATPSHFVVALNGGTTTGTYTNSSGGVHFTAGTAGHSFTKPTTGGTGIFTVGINLSTLDWLKYDWDQNTVYSDTTIPNATYMFGAYRGRDRVLYWHERL